jgi:hypothetical protein
MIPNFKIRKIIFPTKTGFHLNLDGKDIVQTIENKESIELSDKKPIR